MEQDFRSINHLWRLVDPLNVDDAAALIAGFDPKTIRYNGNGDAWFESESGQTDSEGIRWIETAFTALTNAITGGKLKAKLVHDSRQITGGDTQTLLEMSELGECYGAPTLDMVAGENERLSECMNYFVKCDPNWARSTVSVDDVRAWLQGKGVSTGFFFPDYTAEHDFLDPNNSRYAPKLAAAVRAWQAVIDPGKKSPKQAIDKWLRENAAEFGLTDDEGKPVEQAVADISKVANWQLGGGAPKTPSQ